MWQRHKVNKSCWKNDASRLAQCMLATNFQVVKRQYLKRAIKWSTIKWSTVHFCKTISFTSRDNFFFFFSIWMLLISVPYPIALARASSNMLNKSSESGHPFLIPDLRGKTFNISPLSMMLAVGFVIYGLYYVKVCSFYTQFVESIYHERKLYFVKCFSCIYWDGHMIFIFYSINVIYHSYWFVYVKSSLHPWDKSHLITVYDSFNVLMNSVCQFLLRIFASILVKHIWL